MSKEISKKGASRNKQSLTDQAALTTHKNPLSQTLGIVLRKMRLALHPDPNAIASALNIQPSYYRAVEAGTYNLHISNALKLYEAFSGKFSYEAIQSILSTVSIIDVTIKEDAPFANRDYYKSFTSAFRRISDHDERIRFLFEKFSENDFLKMLPTLSQEAINKSIIENRLDIVVENFLINYKTINVDPTAVKESRLAKALLNCSTLYYDNVESYLDSIEELPTRVRFSDLWKWENTNTPFFTQLHGVFQTHNPITCYENLKRYTYPYLWSSNFSKLNFIFLDEGIEAFKIKEIFLSNLKKSLQENNKQDLLKRILEVEKKLNFKVVNPSESTSKILTGRDWDNLIFDKSATLMYDAFWVFIRREKHPVSFLAIKNMHRFIKDYEYFVEGSSLNLPDTISKYNEILEVNKS